MALSNQVDKALTGVFANEYASAFIVLFLILYGSMAAPHLPKSAASIFDNVFVKLFLFFAIAYLATQSPVVALILALVIFISLNGLKNTRLAEMGSQIVNIRNEVIQESSHKNEPSKPRVHFKEFVSQSPVTEAMPEVELAEHDEMFRENWNMEMRKRMLPGDDNESYSAQNLANSYEFDETGLDKMNAFANF